MAGVALVTGGSPGIGAAVALELAERGSAVVVNHAADGAAAAEVIQAVEARGGRAVGVRADVTSSRDVRSLFDAAQRQFGGVDVLVASAGVIATAQRADTSDEDFERQVAVNLRGTFNAFREAARRLWDGGRIVGVSSTTLTLSASGYGAYNATKGVVEGLVRVPAKELGRRGITVNAFAPGPVETDLFLRGKTGAEVARLAGLAQQGRIGRPFDIAHVVGFLASAAAAWVNGQVVCVNGGIA